MPHSVPAIVTAGDRHASKAIHGESKVYLEMGGRALVVHVVEALQRVPEVSEVWLVGDAERLRALFTQPEIEADLRKPLHIVPQLRNLFENGWETYRRLLPGAGPDGRDPGPADERQWVLYLSADIPFATSQEISEFIRRSLDLDCDYTLGLVTEESMEPFYPSEPGQPGIRMAYFNLRQGRFRQSNLHLIRPARITNRYYIEEMYEHRHQRELWPIFGLAWKLVTRDGGGLSVLVYYALMHLTSLAERRGWAGLGDLLRRLLPLERIERGVTALLRADFRLVITDVGGCGIDIDNEHDYEVAVLRYADWRKAQLERAEALYGPLALPASTTAPRTPAGPTGRDLREG